MKISDMISMCFGNLFRRKMRSILTVVGVVVGTCAIVVMISLGLGMNLQLENTLAQMGSRLTTISVYNYRYSGMGEGDAAVMDRQGGRADAEPSRRRGRDPHLFPRPPGAHLHGQGRPLPDGAVGHHRHVCQSHAQNGLHAARGGIPHGTADRKEKADLCGGRRIHRLQLPGQQEKV